MLKYTKKINAVLVIASLAIGIIGVYTPVFADATSYSGQSAVVSGSILGQSINLADTGRLPSAGDALHAASIETSVAGVLTSQTLHATVIGVANQTSSQASNANLNLTVGGNSIAAGFLLASGQASCQGGNAATSGSSQISSLRINGISVASNGTNQTIPLLNGKIVLNEQSVSSGEITVTALRVIINNVADIAIARATAGIGCDTQTGFVSPAYAASSKDEFVTGGGWIVVPSGDKGNFGVAGGIRKGEPWGHLTYIDHGIQMKVKDEGVTAYCSVGTARRIMGNAKINGESGFTYTVNVADNGEPGQNDTFMITLSNGYTASGTLQGGNIQLHNEQDIPPCGPIPPECEPPFVPNPNPPPDCIFDPGEV